MEMMKVLRSILFEIVIRLILYLWIVYLVFDITSIPIARYDKWVRQKMARFHLTAVLLAIYIIILTKVTKFIEKFQIFDSTM